MMQGQEPVLLADSRRLVYTLSAAQTGRVKQ